MSSLFDFPNPVDEVSARLVATGVVLLGALALVTLHPVLLVLLAYGFVARVLTGPTLSPLGRLVTEVVRPRLPVSARPVPGPPKRFAQGVGAVFSTAVLALALGGADTAARTLLGVLLVFASLEAFAGFCMGCLVFGWLMRAGVVPEHVCAECADLSLRTPS
jgi:hypothetical protein